jgi:thiamine kinase-like enzyme
MTALLVRAGDVVRHPQHPWSEATRMLLDFEYARPGDPLDDVAFALEYVVPFRDDATCLRWHRLLSRRTGGNDSSYSPRHMGWRRWTAWSTG